MGGSVVCRFGLVSKLVNMVLNVHRNHEAYEGQGEAVEEGMEVGAEGDYKPIATLSPPG